MGKNRAELAEAIQLLVNNLEQLRGQMTELKLAVRANTLQMHAQGKDRGTEVLDTAKIAKDPPVKKTT